MENYKELLNDKSFSGIIVILDNKSNIIDANEQFLSLLGFAFEDISNKHITELIVPDEKSLFLDIVYTQDVSNTMTLKFYHKSGAFRFFSFSIMNFDNYKILFGNTLKKDFLARKYEYKSEKKTSIEGIFENIVVSDIRELLSFDNNPLSLLLDLMPIEIWVKDKIGKYVFVNETYSLATGVKLEDCLMKDDYQLFAKETAKSFVETDDLAINSGKKISFSFENSDEKFATFAEVTKIPMFNNEGKYIGMLGFSVNTSHSRATEILLKQEQDRLLFVLDNIEGMVFEINSKSELEFVSGNLRKLLGFDMDNNKLMDLFMRSSKTVIAREKLNLALNGKKVFVEAKIMDKKINFSLNPIRNNDGSFNIVGFGSIVTNGGDSND